MSRAEPQDADGPQSEASCASACRWARACSRRHAGRRVGQLPHLTHPRKACPGRQSVRQRRDKPFSRHHARRLAYGSFRQPHSQRRCSHGRRRSHGRSGDPDHSPLRHTKARSRPVRGPCRSGMRGTTLNIRPSAQAGTEIASMRPPTSPTTRYERSTTDADDGRQHGSGGSAARPRASRPQG